MKLFRQFRLQIFFRLMLLGVSIAAFVVLASSTKLYATIVIVGIIIVYLGLSLVRYVEKTNRDLSRFLLAIEHDDYSHSFSSKGMGSSFEELERAFGEVIGKLKQTRLEKEMHYRYLQTVVQHIGIGLIAFTLDGKVDLINTAAKRLLKVIQLRNIRSLETYSTQLVDMLFRLKGGEKALVKVGDKDEMQDLAIYATRFRIREQEYTLVSLQNIHRELEEKEMEAWQRLIRVLTHEIMNSMTPIASLSSTVNELLDSGVDREQEDSSDRVEPDKISDIRSAMQTIHKRSLGLMHFVNAYRNLTLIPKPVFKIFPVSELFQRVENLMGNKFKEKGVHFHDTVEPESLELTADSGMIEQVLINLLLNASDAVENQKEKIIRLTAELDERSRVMIKVFDNGPGIVEEALEKVFIPFFTTKKEGSGIGLSISRQIMRMHRGTISVHSTPDVETVFKLKF